ncbi:MAG: hypothetical protein KIT84_32405 [Labilithrix sp.]|nr:hypothetical protein [Labilithrix sp.]MCW5815776.1 hypothetical protein [Labilithrix sp.]
MSRLFVLGACLLGCGTSATTASEPVAEETFTMTTSPPPYVADDTRAEPFGPSPWSGRLTRALHRYSNGCTDHRQVDLLALAQGDARIPILLGWRRVSRYGQEPRFLTREEDLPPSVRGHACVLVTGSVVTYAHEGYSGAPAYAIAATLIEPCR